MTPHDHSAAVLIDGAFGEAVHIGLLGPERVTFHIKSRDFWWSNKSGASGVQSTQGVLRDFTILWSMNDFESSLQHALHF